MKGLKLECTASIGSVYWQSFQEKIPVGPRETPAAMAGNWWTGATSSGQQAPSLVGGRFGLDFEILRTIGLVNFVFLN